MVEKNYVRSSQWDVTRIVSTKTNFFRQDACGTSKALLFSTRYDREQTTFDFLIRRARSSRNADEVFVNLVEHSSCERREMVVLERGHPTV